MVLTMFQDNIYTIMTQHSWVLPVSWILEMVLVIAITPMSMKNTPMALPAYLLYSALNGFTLTFSLAYFTLGNIMLAFVVTAGMFFGLSAYGRLTKRNLSGMGKAAFAGLIGLILVGIVNLFLQSSGISIITAFIGVLIFAGLIAWDNQRIERVYYQLNGNVTEGWAISQALGLYLDFINMFLYILRIFGFLNSKD
jgi:FtsH-binding integral membrane protein